ncbi:TadE/TadG family type IV pilus assembly protein [Novosphingobium sp. JCM 18896]|uniref:TadE/TadG family type IV pilus assembly protein n=1 Tax=Novosphingobium sp. JCM 18896 TaxID=2989731 RepID=UPI00222257E2|nr:TadE/TadG family type IV pilus assembly protein [Novosphingobium sp. JCM 18896]MCW1429879.1 pilus assembly protein [Novosphingobium sp. JCM 18896]
MNLAKKLLRDQDGITAVEFAIVAPVMLLLIMGAIEMGFMMFQRSHLDGVLRTAARMAVTGDTTTNGQDGALIDAYVKKAVPLVKGGSVDITKQFYDAFTQVRKPEKKYTDTSTPPYCFDDVNGNQKWDTDPSRTGLGGADDIINYKVTLTYDALFPLVTNVVTKNKQVTLVSQITLRNEPFAGGTDQQVKKCCVSAAAGNPVTCT